MKNLLTIISCLLALNLTAQEVVVEYPYNPDFENDGNVGVEDLMQLLASFGMGFDVDELTIDEVALSEWLQAISETLVAQQALIDSISLIGPNVTLLDSSIFSSNYHVPVLKTRDWPMGQNGKVVNHIFHDGPYEVPQDSVLFITKTKDLEVAGAFEYTLDGLNYFETYNRPLPLPSGAILESANDNDRWFSGVLIKHSSDVEIIFWDFVEGNFVVPSGKIFLPRWTDGNWGHLLTGIFETYEYFDEFPWYAELTFSEGTQIADNNGFGGMLGYLVDKDFFESSSQSVTSDTESLGLAFGEKEFWDLDILEWLQIEFPQMDVAFIEAQTDGILHVDGTDIDYPPYGLAVVPSALLPCDDFDDCNGMTIASIFMGNDFENYQYNDFSNGGGSAPVTIAVKEGEVICLRRNSYTASWQRFIWVPIVSDSSVYNEPVSQGPSNAISDTLIIDVGDQYSDWYGSPVPFAAEKPFVKFVGQAPVNPCYFELAIPNDSVPDVVIFNDSENTVRGNTFTGGNYLLNNEWIQLRAIGDEWFKPWYDH